MPIQGDTVTYPDIATFVEHFGAAAPVFCTRLAPISDPLPLTPAQYRTLAAYRRRLAWHRLTTELAFEIELTWEEGCRQVRAFPQGLQDARMRGQWRLDNLRCRAQQRAQAILFPLRRLYALLCLRNHL
jgi:hypothetical protein